MCQQYFSLGNLSGSSQETESFLTTLCVANQFKLTVFIFWLVVYSISILWIISHIVEEIKKRGWLLNLRMIVFLCSLTAYLGQLISYLLFIFPPSSSSMLSSGRYIVFAIAPLAIMVTYYFCLKAWFDTVINSSLNHKVDNIRLVFNLLSTTGLIIPLISIASCYIIGPMVSIEFGRTDLLNYFYLFRLSGSFMSGLNTCAMILYIGHRFLAIHAESAGVRMDSFRVDGFRKDGAAANMDAEMSQLITNLKLVIRSAKFNFVFQLILIFIPLWLLADAYGVFYFHFTINELMMLLATSMMSLALNKRASLFGLSSHSHNSSFLSFNREVSSSVREVSETHGLSSKHASKDNIKGLLGGESGGLSNSKDVELVIASLQVRQSVEMTV